MSDFEDSKIAELAGRRLKAATCAELDYQGRWLAEDAFQPLLLWAMGESEAEARAALHKLVAGHMAREGRRA